MPQSLNGSNKDNLNYVRKGLSEELVHICPTCGLTAANIKDDELSCRGGLTKQIVYRGRIVGTEVYSATGLVSLIQSWVGTGKASIMIQSSRLHLDPTCDAALDTLKSPDCPVVDSPPSLKPTVHVRPQPSAVGEGISVGEIAGIIVGGVIIALLAILIVMVGVAIMRKWKSANSKRYTFCPFDIPAT